MAARLGHRDWRGPNHGVFTVIAVSKIELVRRFVGWLFGARAPAAPTPAPVNVAEPFLLPMLFAARSAPVSDRPAPRMMSFDPAARGEAWYFAERLKSVAVGNVPKARKRPRACAVPPRGKAIPKRSAPILKTYKTGTGVPASAAWRTRDIHSPGRACNVIALPLRGRNDRGLALHGLAA